ncbi:MAG: acetylxylan esterase [Gemmataceae bacterium]|nr:acetylxylan esterase [Gemmataceae bacterium]
MQRLFCSLLVLAFGLPYTLPAGEPAKTPIDKRLGKPKTLNDYFPFTPPTSKEDWAKRRQQVREQVLVANGLWPEPEKTPLKPVVHGKIERDGYTIEKVFFASYPGHYVSGNLYRPTAIRKGAKLPAILSPHGHWANGRFFAAGDKEVDNQMKQGAEQTREGAKYPLQARCAQLARMGCVVFFYDMVGNADSQQIPHRQGFTDVDAELRLQNFMGLQTWNSIRALDFLISLPDVDPERIGVTGASGGGTQTFILCAVDNRPAAAFPAVMVSTAMQGGCICENASYLRVGTGNIELAGLFAPKPLGMAAANDWTIDIETKGLPELQALYKLLGADENVMGKCLPQFGHNYNQVSRELMYNFFNMHLKLGQKAPVKEQPFVPVPPKELSVYNDEHPLPKDAVDAVGLRRYLTGKQEQQLAELRPSDANSLAKYRDVIGTALRTMMGSELPSKDGVEHALHGYTDFPAEVAKKYSVLLFRLTRKGKGESVPVLEISPKKYADRVVVWVHPEGRASLFEGKKLTPAVQKILDSEACVLAVEPFRTGPNNKEGETPVNKNFAGFTYGYNRPLLAERVHDIATAVAFAKGEKQKVFLAGFDKAGPWVVLASGLAGNAVTRTAADLHQFRFERVTDYNDEMMLPGALKYGGLLTLAGLCAPRELYLHNTEGTGATAFLTAAYQVAGKKDNLRFVTPRSDPVAVVEWLVR